MFRNLLINVLFFYILINCLKILTIMVIIYFKKDYPDAIYTCFYYGDYNKIYEFAEEIFNKFTKANYYEIYDIQEYNLLFN